VLLYRQILAANTGLLHHILLISCFYRGGDSSFFRLGAMHAMDIYRTGAVPSKNHQQTGLFPSTTTTTTSAKRRRRQWSSKSSMQSEDDDPADTAAGSNIPVSTQFLPTENGSALVGRDYDYCTIDTTL
jgi:hypothetical protein